jgi:hypothetical protein
LATAQQSFKFDDAKNLFFFFNIYCKIFEKKRLGARDNFFFII